MDIADKIIYKMCPFVAGGMFIGSVYWTAVTYGAVTVMQVSRFSCTRTCLKFHTHMSDLADLQLNTKHELTMRQISLYIILAYDMLCIFLIKL